MTGTPTPTQAELNKIALGESVELADDGSGPDPNVSTLGAPKQDAPKQTIPPRTTSSRSSTT